MVCILQSNAFARVKPAAESTLEIRGPCARESRAQVDQIPEDFYKDWNVTRKQENNAGRIFTPFGFGSTTDDVMRDVDLTGRRAIVTGASSGIGMETARSLASARAHVTLAVRSTFRGETVAKEIRASTGNPNISVRHLDLSNQLSIGEFVSTWAEPLHILVNNAGIMGLPELTRTAEGWELQFATNFLGHFALTVGLHEALASGGAARIVSLSSSAHMVAPVALDDLHFNFLPYDPLVAYGQSKTACALLAVEANSRWAHNGICANALHPGSVLTNLRRYVGGSRAPAKVRKTVAQGAATSVLLAASPLLEGLGGRYFEDCNEAQVVVSRPSDFSGGVAPYALDPDNARRLWQAAERLLF